MGRMDSAPSSFQLDDDSPRRLGLVIHGSSCQSQPLRQAVADLREAGADVTVRVTFESGDARRFAREAAEDDRDVVAMGGDGTLHEVVNGMCDADARGALGIVPAGTGNDFATAAELPLGDPRAALAVVAAGRRHAVDLLTVDVDGQPHRMLNVSTAGLGAEATTDATESAKRWLGNLAYLISGVQRLHELEAQEIRVEGEDAEGNDFAWNGLAFGVAVGNGRLAGGGARLCPTAKIDDGLLDLAICPEMPLDRLLPVVGRTLIGDLLKQAQDETSAGVEAVEQQGVVYRQLRHVEMDCLRPTPINLDGEPLRGRRFRFEVDPGRLEVFLPASSPLLS